MLSSRTANIIGIGADLGVLYAESRADRVPKDKVEAITADFLVVFLAQVKAMKPDITIDELIEFAGVSACLLPESEEELSDD